MRRKQFQLSNPNKQKLADYIKFLDKNPVEYAKYHAWRRDYGVYDEFIHGLTPLHPMCQLCAALHDKDKFEKKSWHWNPHNMHDECSFKKWDFPS